jgi:DNA-binding NarL/FixJ family response regulator
MADSTSPILMKELAASSYNPYKKIKLLDFTEEELEIIRLTCFGLTIQEIAARIYLSERKVSRLKVKIKEETAFQKRFPTFQCIIKRFTYLQHSLPKIKEPL